MSRSNYNTTLTLQHNEAAGQVNDYGGNTANWQDVVTGLVGRLHNQKPQPGAYSEVAEGTKYLLPKLLVFDAPFTHGTDKLTDYRFVIGGAVWRIVQRSDYTRSVQFLVEAVF